MTKDKQIEEMARNICNCYYRGICKMDGNSCDLECGSAMNAYELYNAGYRKASELLNEFMNWLQENEHIHKSKEYRKELCEIFVRERDIK